MLRLNDFFFLLQDGANNDDSDSGTESDEEDDCKGMLLANKVIYARLVYKTMPRMLCNGNGVFPHLQMGVTVMGFVEVFCNGLHNS